MAAERYKRAEIWLGAIAIVISLGTLLLSSPVLLDWYSKSEIQWATSQSTAGENLVWTMVTVANRGRATAEDVVVHLQVPSDDEVTIPFDPGAASIERMPWQFEAGHELAFDNVYVRIHRLVRDANVQIWIRSNADTLRRWAESGMDIQMPLVFTVSHSRGGAEYSADLISD